MKKKLVLMAMLLFAICFAGFAQEAVNTGSSKYIAKGDVEKEYTLIVFGKVWIDGSWQDKKERFVIIAKSVNAAEKIAKNKFATIYTTSNDYRVAIDRKELKKLSVICESTKDACNYDF